MILEARINLGSWEPLGWPTSITLVGSGECAPWSSSVVDLQNWCRLEEIHSRNQPLATSKHSCDAGSEETGLPLISFKSGLAASDPANYQNVIVQSVTWWRYLEEHKLPIRRLSFLGRKPTAWTRLDIPGSHALWVAISAWLNEAKGVLALLAAWLDCVCISRLRCRGRIQPSKRIRGPRSWHDALYRWKYRFEEFLLGGSVHRLWFSGKFRTAWWRLKEMVV